MTVRFWNRVAIAVLAFPLLIMGASGRGLSVAERKLFVRTKDIHSVVAYPQTGNGAIDSVLIAFAREALDRLKADASTKGADESPYSLDVRYQIARNDGTMLGILFTSVTDTGGAHPNSSFATFNFLLADGAQVQLEEIVDGQRGIARVSALVRSDLIRRLASGPNAASDSDTIASGTDPVANNFEDFIWLSNGLRLYFPPYQVASYAAGPQEAFIPLGALQSVLRSDWRAPQASFDCHNAASTLEHAICSDRNLARLDRQLTEAYQAKLKGAGDDNTRNRLRQTERDWLTWRAQSCQTNIVCLKASYRDRIAVLGAP